MNNPFIESDGLSCVMHADYHLGRIYDTLSEAIKEIDDKDLHLGQGFAYQLRQFDERLLNIADELYALDVGMREYFKEYNLSQGLGGEDGQN